MSCCRLLAHIIGMSMCADENSEAASDDMTDLVYNLQRSVLSSILFTDAKLKHFAHAVQLYNIH